jgi:hypothetical protein
LPKNTKKHVFSPKNTKKTSFFDVFSRFFTFFTFFPEKRGVQKTPVFGGGPKTPKMAKKPQKWGFTPPSITTPCAFSRQNNPPLFWGFWGVFDPLF